MFRTVVRFYGEELLAFHRISKLGTTPCHLSATAYSIYSQLSSISEGRSYIRNLRMHRDMVAGIHCSWNIHNKHFI
jgi:hypothetical protein